MLEARSGPSSEEQFTAPVGMPESIQIDEHVAVHKATPLDLDHFEKLRRTSDVRSNIPWARHIDNQDMMEAQLEGWEQDWSDERYDRYRYVITVDDQPAGYFGVWRNRDYVDTAETGSALLPEFRCDSVIPRVAAALEPYVVEVIGAQQMISHVREGNQASARQLVSRGYELKEKRMLDEGLTQIYVKDVSGVARYKQGVA